MNPRNYIEEAVALASRGKIDDAIYILERAWKEAGPDLSVGMELTRLVRGLACDVDLIDNFSREYKDIVPRYAGFKGLDTDVVAQIRNRGANGFLKTIFRGDRLFSWIELYEARDLLKRADVIGADHLVSKLDPKRFPIVWCFLKAKVALSAGRNSDALVAATVVYGFSPNVRDVRLLLGQILNAMNMPQEASRFYLAALNSPNPDIMLDLRPTAVPVRLLLNFSAWGIRTNAGGLAERISRIAGVIGFVARLIDLASWTKTRIFSFTARSSK